MHKQKNTTCSYMHAFLKRSVQIFIKVYCSFYITSTCPVKTKKFNTFTIKFSELKTFRSVVEMGPEELNEKRKWKSMWYIFRVYQLVTTKMHIWKMHCVEMKV